MRTGRWQSGGFFQVDNQIFSMGLSPRDLAVYCCIAMHSNRETGVAYPSRRTIAKECGIQKVETVDRAIKVLCAKGMLEKRHQIHRFRRQDQQYLHHNPFMGVWSSRKRGFKPEQITRLPTGRLRNITVA